MNIGDKYKVIRKLPGNGGLYEINGVIVFDGISGNENESDFPYRFFSINYPKQDDKVILLSFDEVFKFLKPIHYSDWPDFL